MAFGSGAFSTKPFGTSVKSGVTVAAETPGGEAQLAGLAIYIGSANVTSYVLREGWKVSEELNSRDTATFKIVVNISIETLVINPGQVVRVLFGATVQWKGVVHNVDIEYTSNGMTFFKTLSIEAVDRTEVADRKVVAEIYENMQLGAIVRDIVSKYLSEDGIIEGDIHSGPTIAKVVFAQKPAGNCLDQLAKLAGYHWAIDQLDALHFFPKYASLAPFQITEENAIYRKAKLSRSLDQYRNEQISIGGFGITDPLTRYFTGDGVARQWTLDYNISTLISLKIDGLTKTVGIRGVDEEGTKQYYYNPGQPQITQDPSEPLLTNLSRAEAVIRGSYGPLVAKITDWNKVNARKQIEGGSGRHAYVDQDGNLDGLGIVISKIRADIRRFGSVDDMLEFETDTPGLAIGQTVTVNMPGIELVNAELLIVSVDTVIFGIQQRRFVIRCTTGELKGTYQEFYQEFLTRGTPVTLNEDDILTEVISNEDDLSALDFASLTASASHTAVCGVDYVGYAEVG